MTYVLPVACSFYVHFGYRGRGAVASYNVVRELEAVFVRVFCGKHTQAMRLRIDIFASVQDAKLSR